MLFALSGKVGREDSRQELWETTGAGGHIVRLSVLMIGGGASSEVGFGLWSSELGCLRDGLTGVFQRASDMFLGLRGPWKGFRRVF